MKKIYAITGILLILAVALSGCSLVKTSTVSDGTAENVSQSAADKSPAAGDTDTTAADTSSEEELIATVAQTITTNGTHTITGTVNGQILVIAEDVTLILDSATINCSDGAGILGYYEGGKQNLTVELSGACSVTSAVNHGIQGKDNLIISGDGAVDITAAKDGLHAGDDLTVESSTLRITADDDGIQAGNETDGTGLLLVGGGDITVSAGGGASGSSNAGGKGVNSANELSVTGGTLRIDSLDDSLHANGNVSISEGIFTLSTTDDGIHADGDLTISSGEITVEKSFEALEGNNVYISGGIMNLIASDDGINAAGGSSNGTDGAPGQFGGDHFMGGGGGNNTIDISGGEINFYAGGDGLDSNGGINISGGNLTAIINSSADNSALDCDGELIITGGTVIAGGTGTFESVSASSSQSYVYLSNIAAGAEIAVQSGSETVASYTADREIYSLVLFAPGITSGQDYTALISGQSTIVTAGTGGGMGMGGPGGMGGMSPGGRR